MISVNFKFHFIRVIFIVSDYFILMKSYLVVIEELEVTCKYSLEPT